MIENELVKAIKEEIERILLSNNIPHARVMRAGQPTDQAPQGSAYSKFMTTVYINRISNPLITNTPSYTEVTREPSYIGYDVVHTKSARFQIDVVHNFDHKKPRFLTGNDIAEIISDELFENEAINNLRKKGVRIESRTEIIPRFIVNDKDRFESLPCFDIVVTYENIKKVKLKSTDKVILGLHRI